VLERDDRRVAFTREETVEAVEQIFLDLRGKLLPLLLQILKPIA
jgi:hypothetical protein